MTFKCFICNNEFKSLKGLFLHLDLKHSNLSEYSCTQSTCNRRFQNIKSYKRHLLSHNIKKPGKSQIRTKINHTHTHNELSESSSGGCFLHTESKLTNDFEVTCNEHCETEIRNVTLQKRSFLQFSNLTNLDGVADTNNKTVFDNSHIENLQNKALNFALSLYSNPNLNRATATNILTEVTENITKVIGETLTHYMPDAVINSSIQAVIDVCSTPFEKVDTEWKLLQYFEGLGCYIKPQQYIIDSSVIPCLQDGSNILQTKTAKGTKVSLKELFKCFFELPSVFDSTLKNMENLQNQTEKTLNNFIQGSLWKSKISGRSGIFIPYFLYFDDFETGNALGSHSGKQSIAATYLSFPTLPLQYLSLLENILVASLFNTSLKKYGKDSLFHLLISELKNLETEGINIVIESKTQKVHFILGLIIGDNLGLNYLLGFSQSFSSNFYCRFCKTHKSVMSKQTVESVYDLRNRDNYTEDLSSNDPTGTGVNGGSIFNTLPTYHVTENMAVDIMHDIFEGVCHYDICNMLLYYVHRTKLFSLSTLNNRLSLFDYSAKELDQKPTTEITIENLKNKKLKMSASEMSCFVNILPFLIGDLVPEDDRVWNFFLNLLKIIDILLMSEIDCSMIEYLKYLVTEHHEQYLEYFNDTLKPKHHFMIHYPSIIKSIGPLKHIWCMRFEAKHKQLKQTAYNTSSKRNIPLTLMIKQQLNVAQRAHTKQGFSDRLTFGSVDNTAMIRELTNATINGSSIRDVRINSVTKHGTMLRPGLVITIFNEQEVIFYKIVYILKLESDIILLCKNLINIGFNEHIQSYQLHENCTSKFECLKLDNVTSLPIVPHLIPNGDMYCRVKY
ncbi:uncharacterized protein LOC125233664 isoform X1 [Leguminivora glycinivorella]|uniref:uncharacterized protein LOC125233664 isoform X1 n=1 Tax=Leguminivora glycinivorella TaxID=1035111 RepID=UPI00200E3ED5|nr:uncharacterized protein LOC125233664 isoform X1 [Leguminivora glycinivorella]XP_047995689.1 uncharacterized protein LOC125233664 isoform X1 [Leguminivora glycinivorella]XP_047995691.1 uncharacterized protein LOC125233664 isoform X1 [Leguminivora glycinivorella]XP_047995692.1 uncharacterized protein LOC125233664 isoform X1 [Leguminivora glycinivorella]